MKWVRYRPICKKKSLLISSICKKISLSATSKYQKILFSSKIIRKNKAVVIVLAHSIRYMCKVEFPIWYYTVCVCSISNEKTHEKENLRLIIKQFIFLHKIYNLWLNCLLFLIPQRKDFVQHKKVSWLLLTKRFDFYFYYIPKIWRSYLNAVA